MTKVAPMRNPIIKKNLFYPGAGYDFSTLLHFMFNSDIINFYYCDYYNAEFRIDSILNNLNRQFSSENIDCKITHVTDLNPQFYKENDWIDFWHEDQNIIDKHYIENSYIALIEIKTPEKKCFLYYFGTEAVKTYQVLLINNIIFDVVVTQDHGSLGGLLWTTFCKGSELENLSLLYDKMPKILMVGENQESWNNYTQISEPFGRFGLHKHPRILFQYNGNLTQD